MMKDIEEDQVFHRLIRPVQRICVLHTVQPRIGEEVGSKTVGQRFLDVAHAGAKLQRGPLPAGKHPTGNGLVEGLINTAQYRLALPVRTVLLNFNVVLGYLHHEVRPLLTSAAA